MTVTKPGVPSPPTCFHLVAVDTEGPDMVNTTRATAGEAPTRGQRQGAGLPPADVRAAGAGFHIHTFGDHAT